MQSVGRLATLASCRCHTCSLVPSRCVYSLLGNRRIPKAPQLRWNSSVPTPGPASKPRGNPALIGANGLPLQSSSGSGTDPTQGAEIELTAQNAAQVLQSPAPVLMQVGEPENSVTKKLGKLRSAAQGRLPLVKLDCSKLPQICQALQIRNTPAVFLMARGQVAAALEEDLSPQSVTGFVEKCGQMLGLQVNLSEGVSEQLAEAEEVEWQDAEAAMEMFTVVGSAADLSQVSRVRASAGIARCAFRLDRSDEAKGIIEELASSGHDKVPEVKQAIAIGQLYTRNSEIMANSIPLETLKSTAEATPKDFAAVEPHVVASFWAGEAVEAVDAGLALLRRKRTEEARQLVLTLVDALGPRHPRYAKARRSFSSALFA